MRRRGAAIVALLAGGLVPAGCTPTPPPVAPTTGCIFDELADRGRMLNCVVGGTLPDDFVDAQGGRGCSLASFTLSDQIADLPIHADYGAAGEDGPGRVRLAATVTGARHSGRLARSVGIDCAGTSPPQVAVASRFGRRHVARIDKDQFPVCVFESRLDLAPFELTIGPGLDADLWAGVRASLGDALARRLDFELASAVNRMLAPDAPLEGAFRTRAGRCPADYRALSGN